MNSKRVDYVGQGACIAFCLIAGGMIYGNSQTKEIDATITAKNLIVGHDIMSKRAVQTDMGTFAIGSAFDEASLKEGQRYHLTIYKTLTDPAMLGVPGTIQKAQPAP